MKKNTWITAMLIIAVAFNSCIKTGIDPSAPGGVAVPTEVGIPTGNATTKTIGINGGAIVSADGKVELQIPAGALIGNTDISIQPITNNAPNGISDAYRLTPDGLKFSTPVILKIHYTDADVSSTLSDLMGIAFQDTAGFWRRVKNFSIDANSKTISAPITHFSDWTPYDIFNLTPSSAAVRVGETVAMQVTFVDPGNDDADLSILIPKDAKCEWAVNGASNGNETVGTIIGTNDKDRVYKAPAKKPSQNPVAVSVKMPVSFKYDGQVFNNIKLVSNINVFEGDEVYLMEFKWKITNGFEGILVVDSVSMRVTIHDTTVTVTDIKNFAATATPQRLEFGNTSIVWVPDPVGMINITSATGRIARDYFGPGKNYYGFDFTHTGTHYPEFRRIIPPNVDEHFGGQAIDGSPGGTSFTLTNGQKEYHNGPPENTPMEFKITLQL